MITNLLVMAAGILACHPNPENIPPSVMVAFAMQESSGREQVLGDKGQAWGLFQFHRARWQELGGKKAEWGSASAAAQMEVMYRFLTRCYTSARAQGKDPIQYSAVVHNVGHWIPDETKYVEQLRSKLKLVQSQ